MNAILYGGAFNPPHLGHAAAALAAWKALKQDRLIWVPSNLPPHKAFSPDTPDGSHRLKMSALAVKDMPWAEVSDIEMRLGLSYTVDAAAALVGELGLSGLTILIGSDMLCSLPSWHRAGELMALYPIAALPREEDDRESLTAAARALESRYGARVTVLPHSPVEISSTELRALLKTGGGREYLSAGVFEYIRENGLYGATGG